MTLSIHDHSFKDDDFWEQLMEDSFDEDNGFHIVEDCLDEESQDDDIYDDLWEDE